MRQQIPTPNEYQIPQDFHRNLRQYFISNLDANKIENSVFLLRGAETIPLQDDDQELTVDQESNFHYFFGVQELDCYGVLELDTARTTIFTPRYDESSKIWSAIKTNEEFKVQYQLDEVYYVDELLNYLRNKQPQVIYINYGIDPFSRQPPSIPEFEYLRQFKTDTEYIYPILTEVRAHKTKQEIDIMRYNCRLSSEAHILSMQKIGPGNKEYQIAAMFNYHTHVTSGSHQKAYDCICASGRNGATLHYMVNSKTIEQEQLIVCDMGGKYYGYCSDITVTYPSNGKFNEKQKLIYNAVLDAQTQVNKALKTGLEWMDMHYLAERTIAQHLHNIGILIGNFDEIISKRIATIFFPHGLGHMLGLRTHDVGGLQNPSRLQELDDSPFMSRYHLNRTLGSGMVFTNEPGIYFIEYLIQLSYQDPEKAKYLNKSKIDEFMSVGGVRLEDDIVLTENGIEILNLVPRSIEQVEACMRGEDWQSIA